MIDYIVGAAIGFLFGGFSGAAVGVLVAFVINILVEVFI
jgi:hypothetical protein